MPHRARIRPLEEADAEAAEAVAAATLPAWSADEARVRRARTLARIEQLLGTDPGGGWVAEDEGGVVGVALAFRREGIWALSLLAVAAEHQGRGIGGRLLGAAWAYGAGCRGHLVLSSPSPAAMRAYARLGLHLRPCVSAAGIVGRAQSADADGVHDAGPEGIAVADAIGRAVRGAGHGDDLGILLGSGGRLLLLEDRAFALAREGTVLLLAGRDEHAAERVLAAALATAPAGTTAHVGHMTAGQDWAVRTCLDAGLALSPEGPLFCAGELGPLRPYLPSGAYL